MEQQRPRRRPFFHEGNYAVGSAEEFVPGSAQIRPEHGHMASSVMFSQFDSGASIVIDRLLREEIFRTNLLNPNKLSIFVDEDFDIRSVILTVFYRDKAFDEGVLRARSNIPVQFLNDAMQTSGRMRVIAGALAEKLINVVMEELGWEVTVAEKPNPDDIRMIRL